MKIPTGFSINPLVGHVNDNQIIGRYIKTGHFIDLLRKESLWFTRIYNWQLIDPCEGEILPVFKKYLKSQHKNEYEHNFHKTLIDSSLKSNFGCCFSLYEGHENNHMWQVFTPESTKLGVLILVKAIDLYNSILRVKNIYGAQYFSKVKYLDNVKEKSMGPLDCSHSNKKNFHFEESHFLKRISYADEKEVRAVLSTKRNNWTTLLHEYIAKAKIPYYPINTPTPKDCISIKMRDSMVIDTPRDRIVFLNRKNGENFIQFIKDYYENKIDSGVYVPFDLSCIQKIILHPKLSENNETYNSIQSEAKNKNIKCKIVISDLYKKSW